MKKQETQNKGITLIALVITIIVMLILVAVTISMAVNGGLFEYASNAGKQTNGAVANEQLLASGQVNIDNVVYNSIDEYVNSGKTEGITASVMQSDLATYLGKEVNYGVQYSDVLGNNKWEIFYADENHIYLITKGYVPSGALSITGYDGTSDFTEENGLVKYPAVASGVFDKFYDPNATGAQGDPYLKASSSLNSMKATQYLLDSTVWEDYASDAQGYADWVIGGPTLELFVKVYNLYFPNNKVSLDGPNGGYGAGAGFGLISPFSFNTIPSSASLLLIDGCSYWLSSPAANYYGDSTNFSSFVYYVDGNYCRTFADTYSISNCFRPVVCLDRNVQIIWNNSASQYDLSWATKN